VSNLADDAFSIHTARRLSFICNRGLKEIFVRVLLMIDSVPWICYSNVTIVRKEHL
jgi:hypothetical protein